MPPVAEIDTPAAVEKDLRWWIEATIEAHPRSQQKIIGPSEIGVPCDRALIHKLAGDAEPKRNQVPWKPTVGTAMHSWMEAAFTTVNEAYRDAPRFALEQRVMVGQIGGQDIWGSCDLYDREARCVVDWKFVGPSRLRAYRRKGPGQQYRTQAHAYGRGWQLRGEDPLHVAVFFLPRDGELRDAYMWAERYDETVALKALDRANQLHALMTAVGTDAACSCYPQCDDEWCDWCATRPPFGSAAQHVAESTAELFSIK